MTYKLGSPTGLMNHWGLFELSCENGRFLAIFSVFRPKIGDLWPFDPKKGSSYKILPPEITYSEGVVALQRESVEKGVTRTKVPKNVTLIALAAEPVDLSTFRKVPTQALA